MEPLVPSEQQSGEFHHFQLVNAAGEVPLSISVFVHYNGKNIQTARPDQAPIESDDVLALHEALKSFDGNFIKAFNSK
jgi:hypothetical protein